MLDMLRKYRDAGYPEYMVNNLAAYRKEYLGMPLFERFYCTFDYFMRCKYVEHLKKKS